MKQNRRSAAPGAGVAILPPPFPPRTPKKGICMLVSKKLVFLELQKTGSTHIKQLLKKTVGGVNDGKHNQPGTELRESGKTFVGSIRDPWGWYMSLFSYGCQKKGGVYLRTTNPARWKQLRKSGALEGVEGFEKYSPQYMREEVYADPDN